MDDLKTVIDSKGTEKARKEFCSGYREARKAAHKYNTMYSAASILGLDSHFFDRDRYPDNFIKAVENKHRDRGVLYGTAMNCIENGDKDTLEDGYRMLDWARLGGHNSVIRALIKRAEKDPEMVKEVLSRYKPDIVCSIKNLMPSV